MLSLACHFQEVGARMNPKRLASLTLFAVLTSSLLLGGCIVAPAPAPYPYYVGEPVPAAPPPPRQEVIGVAPVQGYIWIGGYWGWVGGRHTWVPGRWEAPRPGYRWVPHRWVHEGQGWREHEGHWERH